MLSLSFAVFLTNESLFFFSEENSVTVRINDNENAISAEYGRRGKLPSQTVTIIARITKKYAI